VNQIYRNDTWLQADLFALNTCTLIMSYLPFVKIRKKIFLKNLYGKWLILFDILIKRICMCNFLPRDLHENVISFKDILIKCTLSIDFNVKLKVR
jgi:hypothetical protein